MSRVNIEISGINITKKYPRITVRENGEDITWILKNPEDATNVFIDLSKYTAPVSDILRASLLTFYKPENQVKEIDPHTPIEATSKELRIFDEYFEYVIQKKKGFWWVNDNIAGFEHCFDTFIPDADSLEACRRIIQHDKATSVAMSGIFEGDAKGMNKGTLSTKGFITLVINRNGWDAVSCGKLYHDN